MSYIRDLTVYCTQSIMGSQMQLAVLWITSWADTTTVRIELANRGWTLVINKIEKNNDIDINQISTYFWQASQFCFNSFSVNSKAMF